MCGITGLFDTRHRRDFDRALLQRMNDSQAHRGPDGDGLHLEPGVALGHRRLSIIDVATGQQPLFNEDGSVVVVFNGEIYNYQSLIPELQALGHMFHTRSDTEVIVHAWEAWGERCVDRFRGMFAFALYDRNRETLFMARDRLGVKPLYYSVLPDGTLLFGSELKSLMAASGTRSPDRPVRGRGILRARLRRGAAHDLHRHEEAAAGAHAHDPAGRAAAEIRSSTGMCGSIPAAAMDLGEACDELNRRLAESVRLRMISEVPLGAFLSGGVDSSAVVATMARISSEPVNTCSISFDDPAVRRVALRADGGRALRHAAFRRYRGERRFRPGRPARRASTTSRTPTVPPSPRTGSASLHAST